MIKGSEHTKYFPWLLERRSENKFISSESIKLMTRLKLIRMSNRDL